MSGNGDPRNLCYHAAVSEDLHGPDRREPPRNGQR
jgi:hypothetical protein